MPYVLALAGGMGGHLHHYYYSYIDLANYPGLIAQLNVAVEPGKLQEELKHDEVIGQPVIDHQPQEAYPAMVEEVQTMPIQPACWANGEII